MKHQCFLTFSFFLEGTHPFTCILFTASLFEESVCFQGSTKQESNSHLPDHSHKCHHIHSHIKQSACTTTGQPSQMYAIMQFVAFDTFVVSVIIRLICTGLIPPFATQFSCTLQHLFSWCPHFHPISLFPEVGQSSVCGCSAMLLHMRSQEGEGDFTRLRSSSLGD